MNHSSSLDAYLQEHFADGCKLPKSTFPPTAKGWKHNRDDNVSTLARSYERPDFGQSHLLASNTIESHHHSWKSSSRDLSLAEPSAMHLESSPKSKEIGLTLPKQRIHSPDLVRNKAHGTGLSVKATHLQRSWLPSKHQSAIKGSEWKQLKEKYAASRNSKPRNAATLSNANSSSESDCFREKESKLDDRTFSVDGKDCNRGTRRGKTATQATQTKSWDELINEHLTTVLNELVMGQLKGTAIVHDTIPDKQSKQDATFGLPPLLSAKLQKFAAKKEAKLLKANRELRRQSKDQNVISSSTDSDSSSTSDDSI